MKIKIFIVTYNNDLILRENLNRIFFSDIKKFNFQIFIINNYKKLNNFDNFNISIIDNVARPIFSCGHLSRSWNQCLINGFKKLSSPDCDLCILMQNDTFVLETTFSKIVKLHEKYDFIQSGAGDQFMSFNVDSVKKSGIFDERFNSIGYQEADYFLNCVITNFDKVSINDLLHKRLHNPIMSDIIEPTYHMNDSSYIESDPLGYHDYNYNLFKHKWGIRNPGDWDNQDTINIYIKPNIKRYMLYPYFEKEILSLDIQNYFI